MPKIFIVSDGTGRTATQALNAAITQFPGHNLETIIRNDVRSKEQIEEAVKEASETKAFIVHTLVSNSLRDFIITTGRTYNVETIDLMGPLLARLSEKLMHSPTEKPGLFSEINKEYFKRIDSMQFAFHHDDGQHPEELHKAIVSMGLHYVKKTKYNLIIVVIVAVFNIGINFILIPLFGIYGAAVASILANMLMTILFYVYSQRYYFISYEFVRIIKLFLFGIVFLFLASFATVFGFWGGIIFKTFLLLLFPLALTIVKFYNHEEISRIKGLLKK
jgi:hypothetical protein